MAMDITLSDGREISFDLSKISIREFRALMDASRPDEEGDELLGRVAGLSAKEVGDLSYLDFRRLSMAFFKKIREPLEDPN